MTFENSTATIEEIIVRTSRQPSKANADKKPKRQPRYQVILWNDDHHSYEYVIVMLKELFAIPVEKGFMMAKEVDASGRVIVLVTTMEHAELKRDQIHAYGKDKSIKNCSGSMSCTIEPVPE